MANKVVKFYRGLSAAYNPTTHTDGIFFTTDTHKIIMNNITYGGDSDKKVSNVQLNSTANGIIITYTDDTTATLDFGDAISITENTIDVKIDPASDAALSKSANGLKVDLSGVKGTTVKVGTAITGGVEIRADQTIVAGMQALSDSIQTAVTGAITSLTSPDETITITGTGTSRGLVVNVASLVSTGSSIQVEGGKLDMCWVEAE